MEIGNFVRLGSDIGRCVEFDDREAIVEFFDAPVDGGLSRVTVPRDSVLPIQLEMQSRVWWKHEESWRVGRVVGVPESGNPNYLIALAGGQAAEVDPAELHPRWDRPISDPVRLLEARTTETRFFHRQRHEYMSAWLALESAAEGLPGVMSSGVELHEHQVRAARRVLLDPVRRYVLADEVGLGKTIEAGMILRQIMLETPRTRAVVLAPDHLVPQWDQEIGSKFHLQGLSGGFVDVAPHSSLATEEISQGYDVVIVDEAHRIANDSGPEQMFERVQNLCHEASSVLLLTATPVRSNEEGFLRLLNLIDPDNYRLNEVDAFRARVEARDEVADALSLLGPDEPSILMPEASETLRRCFPDDLDLNQLLDSLDESLELGDEDAVREPAKHLRGYVSEKYRLHRRLIRTRRSGDLAMAFPVRRRERAESWTLVDPDPRRRAVVEALDRFRLDLLIRDRSLQHSALQVVASRCTAATPAIAGLVAALRDGDMADLLPNERSVIEEIREDSELCEGLIEGLNVACDGQEDARISSAAEWAWLQVGQGTVACMTSYPSVARALHDSVVKLYGSHRAALMVSGMDAEELEASAVRARTDERCSLLVCDSVAEEGWNLQFVDEVLHLDVPWSANRLEQRMGRFDRFVSAGKEHAPIRSRVVVDEPDLDRVTGPWVRLVDQAFDCFSRSSASLQYVLPERERSALEQALDHGFGSIDEALEEEKAEIDRLRRSIEGQDLLDAVDETSDDERFFTRLTAIDRRHGNLRRGFQGWVYRALNFGGDSDSAPWKLAVRSRNPPLLPERTIRTLGLPLLERPHIFDRSTVNGEVLVRPGDPLADALARLAVWDDRGRAFAVFLEVHGLATGSAITPVFNFDFVLGPASDSDSDDGPDLARPTALGLLPPTYESVWVLPGGDEPPEGIQERLRSARAYGLANDRERFLELTSSMDWAATCRSAEADARQIVLARPHIRSSIEVAHETAATRLDQLQALEQAQQGERLGDMQLQIKTLNSASELIKTPELRVDSCGVVFMGPPT